MSKLISVPCVLVCLTAQTLMAQTAPAKKEFDLKKHAADLAVQRSAADESIKTYSPAFRGEESMRIMFYNVENFFDTEDDPKIDDQEFLPEAKNQWTPKRYEEKQQHIAQVLTEVGGWELPEVVGFCEIENRKVLEDLLNNTRLRQGDYAIVHENSADARGIDVGLIYRKAKFTEISHQILRPVLATDTAWHTRDVLYVKGVALGKDTLHIFVNHLPSRRGGVKESEPKRQLVAQLERKTIDQILAKNPHANIILMGDFNDECTDKSIHEDLHAKGEGEKVAPSDLFALMSKWSKTWKLGSQKYNQDWTIIDQLIVSEPLMKRKKGGFALKDGSHVFSKPFLLEEDTRNYGLSPFRTYGGPKYLGGYSDHLPVYMDLIWCK